MNQIFFDINQTTFDINGPDSINKSTFGWSFLIFNQNRSLLNQKKINLYRKRLTLYRNLIEIPIVNSDSSLESESDSNR